MPSFIQCFFLFSEYFVVKQKLCKLFGKLVFNVGNKNSVLTHSILSHLWFLDLNIWTCSFFKKKIEQNSECGGELIAKNEDWKLLFKDHSTKDLLCSLVGSNFCRLAELTAHFVYFWCCFGSEQLQWNIKIRFPYCSQWKLLLIEVKSISHALWYNILNYP